MRKATADKGYFPSIWATEGGITMAAAMFLQEEESNAIFRSVGCHARFAPLLKYSYTVLDSLNNVLLRLVEELLQLSTPVEWYFRFQKVPERPHFICH